jgi:hypothetical protein
MMTKERPIIFTAESVRAILAGTKTMTRRVIKPQPKPLSGGWMYNGRYFTSDATMKDHLFHDVYGEKGTPYGSAYADGTADTLWVRETWKPLGCPQHDEGQPPGTRCDCRTAIYRADPAFGENSYEKGWKPSIHMPRWASRLTLRVVSVRVERVQEITEDDAIAEGILHNWIGDDCPPEYANEWENYSSDVEGFPCFSAADSFRTLWDSINGKRPGCSWASSPWVWVIEFERVDNDA